MKRLISLLLALIMIIGLSGNIFNEELYARDTAFDSLGESNNSDEPWKNWNLAEMITLDGSIRNTEKSDYGSDVVNLDPDELIDVIIELSDHPLIDTYISEYTYDDSGISDIGSRGFSDRQLDMASSKKLDEFLVSSRVTKLRDNLINKQEKVKSQIEKIDSQAELDNNFVNSINAFSGRVSRGALDEIKKMSGVVNVYYDVKYELPEPVTGDESSLGMIDVYPVWNESEYKGEGMVVAIIDTGVDYNHPLFADADISNPKLSAADITAKINEGLTASSRTRLSNAYKSSKVPFHYNYSQDYPYNTNSAESDNLPDNDNHGTHVAGIAAGGDASSITNGSVVVGVAPEAQILAMRVFPNSVASITLKAVEDALLLGATSINMSLGTTAGFTREIDVFSYSNVFKRVKDAGIVLSVSAGNSNRVGEGSAFGVEMPYASNPDWSLVGSPATETEALCVASAENILIYSAPLTLTYDDGELEIVYGDHNSSTHSSRESFSQLLGGSSYHYVDCGYGYEEDFAGKDLTGKIALISRGDLSFSDKVQNATNAGAAAVIIYNNIAGSINMDLSGVAGTEYAPAVSITRSSGKRLLEILSEYPDAEIYVSTEYVWNDNPVYEVDKMSSFTSWGPTPDLKLKPEITAPGGSIYSSMPDGGYANMSGTSMAAPHVTGAMAVISQYISDSELFSSATPRQKSTLIERLIMNTAHPLKSSDNIYVSPRRQGAGMMDVNSAVSNEVVLYNNTDGKAKLELGDKLGNSFSFEFTVENYGSTDRTYRIMSSVQTDEPIPGEDIEEDLEGLIFNSGEPFAFEGAVIRANGDGQNVNIYGQSPGSSTITVPAGGTATVTINVSLNGDNDLSWIKSCYKNGFYLDGFVLLKDVLDDSPDLCIPYLGFYGDWLDAPFMDTASNADLLEYSDGVKDLDDDVPFFPFEDDDNIMVPSGLFAVDLVENRPFALGLNYFAEDYYPYGNEYMAYPTGNNSLLYGLYAGVNLLRNVRSMEAEILDSKGGHVWDHNKYYNYFRDFVTDAEYMRKAYYESGYFKNTCYILPWYGFKYGPLIAADGWYTYKISAKSDYNNSADFNTVWEARFYVDGTTPEMTDSYIVYENGRWIWYMSVEENHYLAAAEAYYDYGGGLEYDVASVIPDYKASGLDQGDTVYFEFDITKVRSEIIANGGVFDPTKLKIYLSDYATNINVVTNNMAFHGIKFDPSTVFLDMAGNETAVIDIVPKQTGDEIPEGSVYDVEVSGDLNVEAEFDELTGTLAVLAESVGTSTVTITMTTLDGGIYKAELTVFVTENAVNLSLNKTEYEFDLRQSSKEFVLTAALTPNVNYTGLIFESSNEAVVKVVPSKDNKSATLTAMANGNARVKVYSPHDPRLIAYCNIKIVNSHLYKAKYVTFDLDGGNVNGYTSDIIIPIPEGRNTVGSDMPFNPSYAGYVFKGWYTGTNTLFTKDTTVNGDITVAAKWEKDTSSGKNNNVQYSVSGPVIYASSTPTPAPTAPVANEKQTTVFGNVTFYTGQGVKYANLYSNGTFAPDKEITRAELAVMLYNLVKSEEKTDAKITYSDVSSTDSYAQAIAYLTEKGVFSGFPDGTFGPEKVMTRAYLVALLSNLSQPMSAKISFSDVSVEHWAYVGIVNANARGWVSGYPDGTFRPDKAITRAEAVTVINKMLGLKKEDVTNPTVISDFNKNHWAYDGVMPVIIY